MLIVNKGSVSHNGEIFRKGAVLSGLSKTEQQRLLDLGVCVEGGASNVVTSQEEDPQNSSDLNLNLSAEDSIVGKK